jgi:hypothetical protein
MNSPSVKKNFLYKTVPALFASGLAFFGLSACGEDPASPETPSPSSDASQIPIETSSDTPLSQEEIPTSATSSSVQKTVSSSSKPVQAPVSSSSKTATASSDEVLNEPQLLINGSCGPKTPIIEKGDMATWSFFRESGDVFDAIMAPFVWPFPEQNKTVQGNGMNAVNVSYEEAGTYTATLNVDGNTITCTPLQVQGIPITINSCKPDKETANAGDVVTWTVDATSDANIVGYSWSYEGGEVAGSGTTGTITLGSDLHKVNVAPTVTVTNDDKTAQQFLCENTYVINPNKVDYTLVTNSNAIAIPSGEVWVVEIPADASTLVCETKGSINVLINDELLSAEPKIDYFGQSIAAYKGQKVQFLIQTNASTADCKVTPW